MKWKVFIVVVVIGLVALFSGYANSQMTQLEQAKADVALEEAKERLVILRVVEEEVRLKVSIIEHQARLAQYQRALTPKPDPNTVDPNTVKTD